VDGGYGGVKQRLMGMPYSMFAPRGGQHTQFQPKCSGAELGAAALLCVLDDQLFMQSNYP
jgi:hypothetical protein